MNTEHLKKHLIDISTLNTDELKQLRQAISVDCMSLELNHNNNRDYIVALRKSPEYLACIKLHQQIDVRLQG